MRSIKCINCNNAGKCLDHREIQDLAGCTSGILDRKAKTNADRIRSMTDEELVDFLMDISMGMLFDKKIMNVKSWLQSEVEE